MTDNGSTMLADKIVQGLHRPGIVHATTLPHSAYQNAKHEHFWLNVEHRLLAMLENEDELTLETLNDILPPDPRRGSAEYRCRLMGLVRSAQS